MRHRAGPYQCGQAMKIGLNTLFAQEKGRFWTILLAGVQRPHQMAIHSHRSGTLTLHRKNEWLRKRTIQESTGKQVHAVLSGKGLPAVQASGTVSGNRVHYGESLRRYLRRLSSYENAQDIQYGLQRCLPMRIKPEDTLCRQKRKACTLPYGRRYIHIRPTDRGKG